MKKLFKLSSLLFIGLVLFQISCKDDPVTPPVDNTPDPTGKWQMVSATLVDGNAGTAAAEDLSVIGYPVNPIPVGDVQHTSTLVGGALAATTCELQASYANFFVELVTGGDLSFKCPDEGLVSTDPNKWAVIEDAANAGTYILTLTVVVGGNALPISIVNFAISSDGATFSGTATGYPMVLSLADPIGPTNIQFITTDLVFKSLP